MRLTSRWGLLFRALLALLIGIGVFVGAALVVAVLVWLALDLVLSSTVPTVVVPAVFVVTSAVFVWATRKTIQAERRDLLQPTVPASEASAGTDAEVLCNRVGTGMGLDAVDLRIRQSSSVLAYTTYRPDDPVVFTGGTTPVVVLSEAIVDALSTEELKAVIAHELAHLANDDLRLMSWALTPLVAAETLHQDDETVDSVFGLIAVLFRWQSSSSRGWFRSRRLGRAIIGNAVRNVIAFTGHVLAIIASVGIGVFSRGREAAADRAAARELGDPSTLAAALQTLEENKRPITDLRNRAQSTSAVNILPATGGGITRLQRTHPPTAARIELLREMAR